MKTLFGFILFIVICAVAIQLSGCSKSSGVHKVNSTALPINNAPLNLTNGYGLNDVASHIFAVEGEVVQIIQTNDQLKYINIKLIKPLSSAIGYEPYKTPGDVLTVYFNAPIDQAVLTTVNIGSVVRISFGQINFSTNWGSNLSWLLVKKDDSFFNLNGDKVEPTKSSP